MVSKCQNVDLSILEDFSGKILENGTLNTNNSGQFEPKEVFGPFLTVGSYQSFQDLCSNIVFFIITATNIYQEQAEGKKKVIMGAKT